MLQESNPEKIQLDYLTIFRDEPNDLGWYIEDKVEARGGSLNSDGTLVHGACYSGDVNQCQSSEFNLESIKNASTFFERRSNLYNSQYNPSGINWFIEYQDSQYANYNVDGSLGERRCSTKHKLLLHLRLQMIVQRICKTIMKLELFSVEILLIAAAKPKKVVFLIETQMELLIQEIICFCLCLKAITIQTTNGKETFSHYFIKP